MPHGHGAIGDPAACPVVGVASPEAVAKWVSRVGEATAKLDFSGELTAYTVGPTQGWVIEPASPRRQWMDNFADGFPYRCLPLAIANQAGWVVRTPVGFSAIWNGAMGLDGIRVQIDERPDYFKHQIQSHFGGGVLTFSLPWLFRTSPGTQLYCRGLTRGYPRTRV